MPRQTQTRIVQPRLPEEARRSVIFSIRLTQRERERLAAASRDSVARFGGARSEGEYVRQAMIVALLTDGF